MLYVNFEPLEVKHFPAGEQSILDFNYPKPIFGNKTFIDWYYENDEELVTLIYITNHIRSLYQDVLIQLDMPYIPHARMDRVKSDKEVFTLKYFAQVINSLNFCQVFTADAHSNVSEALIDRIVNVDPSEIINKILKDFNQLPVIYFPDAGAYKRYSGLECFKNVKMVYGEKIRNWETHRIEGLNVVTNGVDLKDKYVIMVDDIISYGGTFYHSANKLKELGVKGIYAYATHVENEMLNEERGTFIKSLKDGTVTKLFTTNSIFKEENESEYIEIIHKF